MMFAEICFPMDIAYGSSGGPEYATDIVTMQSGFERRMSHWMHPRARYNVAHGVKNDEQLAVLLSFFRARRGRAQGFRFRDWTDYLLKNETIGKGNGKNTSFQIVKRYVSCEEEVRLIKKPTPSTIRVYGTLQGKEQTLGSHHVDYKTGMVIFTSPPVEGLEIQVSGEFDVPVRFDTDSFSASIDSYGNHNWMDIPLIEIRV